MRANGKGNTMKRLCIVAALVLALLAPTLAQAEIQYMWANVYSDTGKRNADGKPELTRVTSGITFKVLAVNADTSETLYSPADGTTSLTNPVTTTNFGSATVCNDRVAFYTDPTDSTSDRYVDLIVVDTAGGYTVFVEDFDKYTHSIIINERPNVMHHGVIWFAPSDNTEVDTGIDFDYDTMIHDVRVEVVTVDATETLDVGLLSTGTAGDANGFRAAISVATAGYPSDTAVITNGSNIDYVPVTTYGALLVTAITGSDAVATVGGKSYIGHIVLSANEQSLTYTGSAGSDTAAGYIHYFFTRMR